MKTRQPLYASVILPLRISMEITYTIPEIHHERVKVGSFVKVIFSGSDYIAVVHSISLEAPGYEGEIKELEPLEGIAPLSKKEMDLWEWVSEYYMCSIGEVFRAAFPEPLGKIKEVRKKRSKRCESNDYPVIELSPAQESVYFNALDAIRERVPILIRGVTGSGKTEIYTKLSITILQTGGNVLFMVPEIAVSRQLGQRLEGVFGNKLLVYHSGQTPAVRRDVYNKIKSGEENYIVLGLRSSVFLPFRNLDLIVIDEEHDSSYKQNEPAPRYNGRDSAIMLAKLHSAGVVLGSATPSLESVYNAHTNRFRLTELNEKYYSGEKPHIEIIDTIREEKRGRMTGLFSMNVTEAVKERLSRGEQTLIFRNRRSYSPMVQCIYCGDIPMCHNCNVALSYHKSRGALSCHYCDNTSRFNTICLKCGKPGLKERGCGTEMIEEQLRALFPNAAISRFDAETTGRITEQTRILKEFADGSTDIMVGTQMISKGFDFERLTLIVLVQADSMFSVEDFRSGERAMQMLTQLAGRGGRRANGCQIIIQTSRPDNPVYKMFESQEENTGSELSERGEFGFPPFTRLIKITLRGRQRDRTEHFANLLKDMLPTAGIKNFTGPVPPPVEKQRGEYLLNFWIKLPRNSFSGSAKRRLATDVGKLVIKHGKGIKLFFDVDPY
ncbi:MAG: primosomal protein N' [Bacteroidales bacterium]